MRSILAALFLFAVTGLPTFAHAEDYPSRLIKIVVPFAAGGAVDILARVIGQDLTNSWGQPVIVENRTGGSSQIATRIVASSKPDGYTLLFTANPHTVNPGLFDKLPYDTKSAFSPITLVTSGPLLLVAHPSLGVQSVRELIEIAKQKAGSLAYASSGTGGPQHMAGELFKYMAKVNMIHIPFKGGGESIPQLIGGHVLVSFSNPISVLEHVRTGKLRAIAVTSTRRAAGMPDVPTIAEAGNLPGYDVTAWIGMLAPAGTPKEIIARLQTEIRRVIYSPKFKERLEKDGNEAIGSTADEFAEFIDREIARYVELIKAAGIRPE